VNSIRSLAALVLLALSATAQEKKEAPKPVPKLLVFMPLGIVPGTTSTVTARGLVLDQATEFKLEGAPGSSLKVKSKGKAAMPKDSEPAMVGDTQAELEITIPGEATAEKVLLTAVTPAGTTDPHPLLLIPKEKFVAEKEPNGGFSQAQPVEPDQVVQGSIAQPRDVDVFRVKGKKGEVWTFEVVAARLGSFLDPILTVYSESGHILATKDDDPGSRDATIKMALPADGVYFLSLVDAHDGGDAMHVYLLQVRRAP
jgi:hypothetical protein